MNTPTPSSTSPSDRISEAFLKLTESAKNINGVSARLNKQISTLEACLKRINAGVACWAAINEGRDGHDYWSQSVGYTRLKGEWCIAIRTVEGADWRDRDDVEEWTFENAPRYLQPKAVERLPELIDALTSATDAAAERLEESIAPAEQIATAVNAVLFPKKK